MVLLVLVAAVLIYLYEKGKAGTAASTSTEPGTVAASQPQSAFQDNLDNFAQAITQMEGFAPGSRAYRNNNPGNIKVGYYSQDRVGNDSGNFAIFADQGDGWDALNNYITRHAQKNPTWNFYDFFNYYLHGSTTANPVDSEGDANSYARSVAGYIGVDPNTPLSTLFGYS